MDGGTWTSADWGLGSATPGRLPALPPFPRAADERRFRRCSTTVVARSALPPRRPFSRRLRHHAGPRGRFRGPKFVWRRLALGGRAAWPEGDTAAAGWEPFRAAAMAAGYGAPEEDWDAVLAAVRLRFRPWARASSPEAADVAAVAGLA